MNLSLCPIFLHDTIFTYLLAVDLLSKLPMPSKAEKFPSGNPLCDGIGDGGL